MILVKKTIEARVIDDAWADGPSYATIEINDKLARRIIHLSEVVQKEDVSQISDYDMTPNFYDVAEPEEIKKDTEPASMDCSVLHVRKGLYFWSAYMKHTDTRCEIEEQRISILKELLKICDTPLEKLPLLINDLESDDAKDLLKKKLSGGNKI